MRRGRSTNSNGLQVMCNWTAMNRNEDLSYCLIFVCSIDEMHCVVSLWCLHVNQWIVK